MKQFFDDANKLAIRPDVQTYWNTLNAEGKLHLLQIALSIKKTWIVALDHNQKVTCTITGGADVGKTIFTPRNASPDFALASAPTITAETNMDSYDGLVRQIRMHENDLKCMVTALGVIENTHTKHLDQLRERLLVA